MATQVVEETLAPSLTQGAQKGVGGVGSCSLTSSLSSPKAHSKGIPGSLMQEAGWLPQGPESGGSAGVCGGRLLGTPVSPGINPQRYMHFANFPDSPLCSAGSWTILWHQKGMIRLGDEGDKAARNCTREGIEEK